MLCCGDWLLSFLRLGSIVRRSPSIQSFKIPTETLEDPEEVSFFDFLKEFDEMSDKELGIAVRVTLEARLPLCVALFFFLFVCCL